MLSQWLLFLLSWITKQLYIIRLLSNKISCLTFFLCKMNLILSFFFMITAPRGYLSAVICGYSDGHELGKPGSGERAGVSVVFCKSVSFTMSPEYLARSFDIQSLIPYTDNSKWFQPHWLFDCFECTKSVNLMCIYSNKDAYICSLKLKYYVWLMFK